MSTAGRLAVLVLAAATWRSAAAAPPPPRPQARPPSRRPTRSAASRPAWTRSRSRSTTTARAEGSCAGGTISAGGGAVPEAEKGRGLVLVVEDDRAIADLVGLYLRRDGFGVQVESDGPAGLAAVRRLRPAAVVLDVGLPGMDGVEVCRRLRAEDDWTPVLFVTARDDEIDRVLGLEMGADDYVTKPFSPRELVARVRTVLRRSGRVAEREEVLAVGEVRVEVDRRRAHAAGAEVALTSTEFDLLTHLMRAPGRVFTREQLLSAVWGYTASAGTRTVDVHVAQLRAKLGPASPIRTVRGRRLRGGPALMRRSLAWRVAASCLVVALVAVAVAAVVALRLVSETARQTTQAVLAQEADIVAAQLADPALVGNPGPARQAAASRKLVQTLQAQGVDIVLLPRARPGTGPVGTALTEANAERALAGVPVSASVDVDGRTYVVEARPGAERGVRVGPPVGHGPAGQRPHPAQPRLRAARGHRGGARRRVGRRHADGPAAAPHRRRGAPAPRRPSGRAGARAGARRGGRGRGRGQRPRRRAGPQRGPAAGVPAVGVPRAPHAAHRRARVRRVAGRRRRHRGRRRPGGRDDRGRGDAARPARRRPHGAGPAGGRRLPPRPPAGRPRRASPARRARSGTPAAERRAWCSACTRRRRRCGSPPIRGGCGRSSTASPRTPCA